MGRSSRPSDAARGRRIGRSDHHRGPPRRWSRRLAVPSAPAAYTGHIRKERDLVPGTPARNTAVVADDRAFARSLVRYLLEERGYEVVAEASTPSDTVRAALAQRPDVIIAHEGCFDRMATLGFGELRAASPGSRIVAIGAAGSTVDPGLSDAVDIVVEDGPDLPQLVLALDGFAVGLRPPVAVAAAAAAASPAVLRRRFRWLERLQGAAAAAVIVLALVMSRGVDPAGG